MLHETEQRKGQRPYDLGILFGKSVTVAIAGNKRDGSYVVMLGMVGPDGKETALPLSPEDATTIAHEMLNSVREIKRLNS